MANETLMTLWPNSGYTSSMTKQPEGNMIRRQPSPRRRSAAVKSSKDTKRANAIRDTLAELDGLEATAPNVKALIDLFRGWLNDESGYDEETWPKLKQALNRERARAGARRLFDA
jgi:hypothetical protein